jgi:hypothetical protein
MRHVFPTCTRWLLGPFVRRRWSHAASSMVRARRPGQAVVEAALTSLLSVAVILVIMQMSLVAAQAYSAAHVARSTARWLAVRIDTIDSLVLAEATTRSANLPGLSGGGMSGVTVNPPCAALTAGKCAGRESGDAVRVTVNTSLTPIMFLPTSFGIAPLIFRLPASMPPIAFTVLLE